jgi:hypothetical protein
MKNKRFLIIVPLLFILMASAIGLTRTSHTWINLASLPYEMKVPSDLANRISVREEAIDADLLKQAKIDGAISVVSASYQPIKGEKAWFMTVFYFNEKNLDKTMRPDEVPPYGFKLFAEDGMAVSVVGPQESAFDPKSQDGKNYAMLYDILYEKKSYRFIR